MSNGRLILRLLGLAWKYRLHVVKLVLLQGFLLGLALSGLGFTGLGIDVMHHGFDSSAKAPRWPLGIAPPASWTTFDQILAIAGLVIGIAAVRFFLDKTSWTWRGELTQRIIIDLRTRIYDKLQRLSFRFFDANESGSIINRCTSDVQMVRQFVDGVMVQVLMLIISLIFFVGYMFSIHVGLTIACLASTPLLWILTASFSKIVRPGYREARHRFDKAVLILSENVQAVHVVKGFSRQKEEIEKFRVANDDITTQKRWIFWCVTLFMPVIGFIPQVNLFILLIYGGYLFIHNPNITLGMLFIFAGLLQQFSSQVGNIANIANSVQRSLTGAQRVFEVLDTPLDIQSPATPTRLHRARGEVRFEHVTFGYEPPQAMVSSRYPGKFSNKEAQEPSAAPRHHLWSRHQRAAPRAANHAASHLPHGHHTHHDNSNAVEDVSFHVKPGQCVAILGATGSGKSTLLSLIPRFYDPTRGRVMIDGVDVRHCDIDELRRNIGIVFQESFLFSNTVAANISFGHPEATQEQIEHAAKLASAHDFILEDLSKGYNTVLSESGGNLSGGQRQRIAIARALLLEPPILLMDDPTAAIDPETEHEILEAINSAMHGRTTFVVAHRLSTLRRADLVLVLDHGRVVQTGTHQQLMRTHGHYQNAAQLQIADDESKRLLGMTTGVGGAGL